MENKTKQPCPIKARIGLIYGSLAKLNPNFKDRPQQKKVIGAIAHVMSLEERASACIEAGTGTGKTYAALLGAVPFALEAGKKVLIATATTALQDQLINKDLPAFQVAFDKPITFMNMKGRSRYTCPKRLYSMCAGETSSDENPQDDVLGRPSFKFKPTPEDTKAIEHMAEYLNESQWDGDRDTLSIPVSNNAWQAVTTDSNSCTRKKCQHYKTCPYYVKKRQIEETDIIVTNQDFLLSDMSMGGGIILPAYPELCVLIDEAHNFSDKAVAASATSYTIKLHANLLGKAEPLLNKLKSSVITFQFDTDGLIELGLALSDHVNHSYSYFDSLHKQFAKEGEEFLMLKVADEHVSPLFENIRTLASDLNKKLGDLLERFNDFVKERELQTDVTDKLVSDLSNYISYVGTTLKTFTVISEPDPEDKPPFARWLEKNSRGNDLIINTSAIDASEFIRDALLDVAYKTIFLSATVTDVSGFDSFIQSTKLDSQRYFTLKVDSPFDFSKSQIVIPNIKSDVNDTKNHAKDVAQVINSEPLEPSTGSLYIFTSKSKLNAVTALLSPEVLKHAIIQDGSLSKGLMIDNHKKAVDAGRHSIIFGLTSFSEGVDLPLKYCEHVLLDKLPFSPVRDPLLITKTEYYERIGRDPFSEISIPEAFRKLTQIVGRLIRTEEDVGKVTICDPRAKSKSYAKKMIQALPPFTIIQ
ncbi:MAG: helicase C-terminal domain-containing protein [Methylophilus sp.]|uniref:helicase C-terminal domain-containing protein n=1 Tax=Methylophilus sp. TaxID=29541 RepID=UPI003F9FFC5D